MSRLIAIALCAFVLAACASQDCSRDPAQCRKSDLGTIFTPFVLF